MKADVAEISERSGMKLTQEEKPEETPEPGKNLGDDDDEEDDDELKEAIRNRLVKILNRSDVPPDLAKQFVADVSADLQPILQAVSVEAQAIGQITDPALRKQKIEELQVKIDSLLGDALLSPKSADSLAGIITAGLKSGKVTNRTQKTK